MRVRLGELLSPETAGIAFETAGISPENDQISQGRNPAGSHIVCSLALARVSVMLCQSLIFFVNSAANVALLQEHAV